MNEYIEKKIRYMTRTACHIKFFLTINKYVKTMIAFLKGAKKILKLGSLIQIDSISLINLII